MKYTNKECVPYPWVAALTNPGAYKKHGDFSVTELLGPAQAAELVRRHNPEIVIDVLRNIHMMSGSGLDYMMEQASVPGKHYNHQRFLFDYVVDDKTYVISFEPDYVYETKLDIPARTTGFTLMDLKDTVIWAAKNGPKESWVNQLEFYWYGLAKGKNLRKVIEDVHEATHHVPEENIKINRVLLSHRLKDWSWNEAHVKNAIETQGYPPCEVMTIEIHGRAVQQIEQHLTDRIRDHVRARNLADHNLPLCNATDRWVRDAKYCIEFKEGKSKGRAVPKGGNFDTYEKAEAFLSQRVNKGKNDAEIVFRPGKNVRCERFCAASTFCHQRSQLMNLPRPEPTQNSVIETKPERKMVLDPEVKAQQRKASPF